MTRYLPLLLLIAFCRPAQGQNAPYLGPYRNPPLTESICGPGIDLFLQLPTDSTFEYLITDGYRHDRVSGTYYHHNDTLYLSYRLPPGDSGRIRTAAAIEQLANRLDPSGRLKPARLYHRSGTLYEVDSAGRLVTGRRWNGQAYEKPFLVRRGILILPGNYAAPPSMRLLPLQPMPPVRATTPERRARAGAGKM